MLLVAVAPACGERSISLGGDTIETIESTDAGVGAFGGIGGSSGRAQGGIGAVANTGGDVATGGRSPTSGTGGTVPRGGSTSGVGGTLPTGGSPATGGTAPTGGFGGMISVGGTMPDAGYGGMVPSGGSTTTGGLGGVGGASGIVNTDPNCRGIRNQMPCAIEGTMCPSLPCGLADSGRRQCACATVWTCTSCDFSESVFRDRPANIAPCPLEVADEVACTEVNTVCGPVAAGEYCACYLSPTDGPIWDCDSPPSTWTAL